MDSDDNFTSDSESSVEEGLFCFDLEAFSNSDNPKDDDAFAYDILSTEEILNEMLRLIEEVNSVFKIPPTTTRILLNHFKWDKDKLYERYYDGDPKSLFQEAHVVNPKLASTKRKRKSSCGSELCEICFKNVPLNMMTSLACEHQYCSECWTMYITTKIMDEGEVQYIACSAPDCDILVDDDTIMTLLVDPKVRQKYQFLITNNFITCNTHLKHCPHPGCSKVVKVQYTTFQPIVCSCGHKFCFLCSEKWHGPITCDILKKWQKLYLNDSANLKWMAVHTKECPSCRVRIEKNGGCNHMQCNNQSCKFEFCWICLSDWKKHTEWDKCTRYAEKLDKVKLKSESTLQKYLFYYDRFMNHTQSLKLESELLATQRMIMEDAGYSLPWVEWELLKKAVDVLCSCRQNLMYTYVFAYYLKKNNQKYIFEDNQNDLQHSVEELSSLLEKVLNPEVFLASKQAILNISRYCDERRKVLVNHVYEGYNKDSWTYNDDT